MKTAGTVYSLKHRSISVFLSGCEGPHCEGCHNPCIWDFDAGEELDTTELIHKIQQDSEMIDHIWIMGGEPLDQPKDALLLFLEQITSAFPCKSVWIFTRRNKDEIDASWKELYAYADYVKVGRYRKDLPSYIDDHTGITLASSNQSIIRIDGSRPPKEEYKGQPYPL